MAELQRLNIYKPPPPYPGNRGAGGGTGGQQGVKMMMSSTSTPDLASVASTSINNYNNLVSAAATSGGVNGNNYPMGGHLHYSRSGHFLLTWICHWGVYCCLWFLLATPSHWFWTIERRYELTRRPSRALIHASYVASGTLQIQGHLQVFRMSQDAVENN